MDKNKVVLSIKGLKKSFGDLQVLKHVDLDVHEGEVISIIGPSGTGKQHRDPISPELSTHTERPAGLLLHLLH